MIDEMYLAQLVRSSWFSIFHERVDVIDGNLVITMRECVKNVRTPIKAWNSEWSDQLRSHFKDRNVQVNVSKDGSDRIVAAVSLDSYEVPKEKYRFKMPKR